MHLQGSFTNNNGDGFDGFDLNLDVDACRKAYLSGIDDGSTYLDPKQIPRAVDRLWAAAFPSAPASDEALKASVVKAVTADKSAVIGRDAAFDDVFLRFREAVARQRGTSPGRKGVAGTNAQALFTL